MFKIFDEYKGLRRELYVLCIGRLVTNLGSMIWPMLTLILNQKLGMNASSIATYMIVITIISMPVSMFGGKLADSVNKKNIIVVCDLVSVICYFAAAFLPLGSLTIAMLVVASIMQSAEGPSYDALIADFTNSKDRERAYSLAYLGANLGLILAPTLGGLLFKNYLWLAFLINSIAIFSSTGLIFFLIKDITKVKEEDNSYEEEVNGVSTIKYLMGNRVILLLILASILSGLVYNQYGYLMPLELGRVHGESGSVIYGTLSSINCIVVVAFTALITKMFRKVRDVNKMVIGEGLIIIGYIIFVSSLGFFYVGYIAMFIFTLGEIFNTLASTPFMSRRIPANHRGRIGSYLAVSSSIVTAVVQKGISIIWDKNNVVAWVIIIAIGLIEVAVVLVMKSLDKKDYADLY